MMENCSRDYLNYINETYEELTIQNSNEYFKTTLVKQIKNGRILIKKELPLTQAGVYQQIRSINHPNLVAVREICYTREKCIIIEDFVSGQTLQQVLEEKEKLSCAETFSYLIQILEGLETIHQYNIIHRDIKPENILISTDGVVKLLDFGIARFQKKNSSRDTAILGTAGYASPEQFGFRQTDVRADIYAVGILLNKMLTGKMPNEEMPDEKKICNIISRCIELDPENRFASVGMLRAELSKNVLKRKITYRKNTSLNVEYMQGEGDLTWIPGFRTGVKWKKKVACIGYGFMLIGSGVYLSEVISGGILAFFTELMAVLIYMWMTFLVASNFLRWDQKIPGIRRLPVELKIMLRVVLCFITVYAGIALDSYARYVLAGIPKPN